jgi:hypothetical protein
LKSNTKFQSLINHKDESLNSRTLLTKIFEKLNDIHSNKTYFETIKEKYNNIIGNKNFEHYKHKVIIKKHWNDIVTSSYSEQSSKIFSKIAVTALVVEGLIKATEFFNNVTETVSKNSAIETVVSTSESILATVPIISTVALILSFAFAIKDAYELSHHIQELLQEIIIMSVRIKKNIEFMSVIDNDFIIKLDYTQIKKYLDIILNIFRKFSNNKIYDKCEKILNGTVNHKQKKHQKKRKVFLITK